MSNHCDILLVEDDPADVDFLKRALLKAGSIASLHVVSDGQQAVTYLTESGRNGSGSELPSLVITDLKMPKHNGLQLIEWIRTQSHLAGIPIVVLSSSDMQQDIDRAIQLGANSYIQKPLSNTELVRIVQSLLATWLQRRSLK
jgi:two-component system, chemotaxis family, response regulator Rcp1